MTLKVAIVGASGYAGAEIARLIENHPELELLTVTANSQVGARLGDYAECQKYAELSFVETTKENLAGHDVVFIALPHTKSSEIAGWFSDEVVVIDCGADFRLRSKDDYENFYQAKHPGTWVYGMPELLTSKDAKQRDSIVGQKRIAVPGCNATAVTLALAPLIAADLVETGDLVATLSVGTSGAGRMAEVNTSKLESAFPYQVGGVHRHIPEIKQNLAQLTTDEVRLTFTPVLVPMFRGILAVSSAKLNSGVSQAEVEAAFSHAYANEKFVELLSDGEYPNTKAVEKTNYTQIAFALDKETNRVTVISALDNLVKGTAGAAIQCLNLAFGFSEDLGL